MIAIDTVTSSRARRLFLAGLGFWLFYFVFWSLRSELLFHDDGGLLWPRMLTALANVLVTLPLFAVLSLLVSRRLWITITAAVLLALPAGLVYALINAAIFDAAPKSSAPIDGHHHHYHGHHGRGSGDAQGDSSDDAPGHALLERASNGYILYLCAGLLQVTLDSAASIRNLERRSADLRSAARLAEIRALRYQVNPHFLFNTLNSLSALVLQKRANEAETMIDNIASFYRNALTQDPTGNVTLAEELRLQQLYLAIEAVRFPGRISVDIDVPPELEHACVPGLILQPLVENAVKHGVARSFAPVTVSVLARAQNGKLLLRVADDAKSEGAATSDGPQIGLDNVINRLAARYDDEASCHWFNLGARGFLVDLYLPLTLRPV